MNGELWQRINLDRRSVFCETPFRKASSDLVFSYLGKVAQLPLKRNRMQGLFRSLGSTFSSQRRKMPDTGSVAYSMWAAEIITASYSFSVRRQSLLLLERNVIPTYRLFKGFRAVEMRFQLRDMSQFFYGSQSPRMCLKIVCLLMSFMKVGVLLCEWIPLSKSLSCSLSTTSA